MLSSIFVKKSPFWKFCETIYRLCNYRILNHLENLKKISQFQVNKMLCNLIVLNLTGLKYTRSLSDMAFISHLIINLFFYDELIIQFIWFFLNDKSVNNFIFFNLQLSYITLGYADSQIQKMFTLSVNKSF